MGAYVDWDLAAGHATISKTFGRRPPRQQELARDKDVAANAAADERPKRTAGVQGELKRRAADAAAAVEGRAAKLPRSDTALLPGPTERPRNAGGSSSNDVCSASPAGGMSSLGPPTGVQSPSGLHSASSGQSAGSNEAGLVFGTAVPSAITTPPPVLMKRKRGRPRKHPLPEPIPRLQFGCAEPGRSAGGAGSSAGGTSGCSDNLIAASRAPKALQGPGATAGARGQALVSLAGADLQCLARAVLSHAAAHALPPAAVWRVAQRIALQHTVMSLARELQAMSPPSVSMVRSAPRLAAAKPDPGMRHASRKPCLPTRLNPPPPHPPHTH